MFDKDSLKVYFICGTQDIPSSKSIKEVVKIALDSGITMFQYREKGDGALIGNDKREMAQQLLELCQSYNVPFIVNDDVTLAENINADGIHVGQNDMKVTEFAQKFKNKIIGLSISDVNEYQQSDLTCVDYIGVGPMYATNSKKDANLPVGPEMIPKLRSYIEDFPLVAIGGITVDNTKEIIQAGADGVSIISAISKSANVSKTVRQFLQNVD